MENILRFKGIITLVGIFLVMFLGFKSWEIWQDLRLSSFDRPTISVQGEGKVFAKPDIGEINLAVASEAAGVEKAQKEATELSNRVFAVLGEKGVEEKDIQTTSYSINPQYDFPDGRRRLLGYEVRQNFKVKIRDLTKVGEILAGAAEAGANQVGGLTFTTEDPAKLQAEARAKAIEDARTKAGELAGKLGVRLGKVVGFSEFGTAPGPVPYFGAERALGGAAPQIPVGENEIRVDVTVIYQIK